MTSRALAALIRRRILEQVRIAGSYRKAQRAYYPQAQSNGKPLVTFQTLNKIVLTGALPKDKIIREALLRAQGLAGQGMGEEAKYKAHYKRTFTRLLKELRG